MTIIRHLSDCHGAFPEPTQEFDLTILSGDLTPDFLGYGKQHSAQQQEHWVKHNRQSLIDWARDKPVYYIYGNHDFLDESSLSRELGWFNCNEKYQDYSKPNSAHREFCMYGFPYVPFISGRWNYELHQTPMLIKMQLMIEKFVDNVFPDVLIVHSPPYGVLDNYLGNVNLTNVISYSFEGVKYVLCGHIHEHGGETTLIEVNQAKLLVSNAATTQNYIEYVG